MEAPSGLERSRLFGLDLMRAVAIVMVVLSHADDLLAPHVTANPGLGAVDGVDLFFVLSGYLIGGILLRYAYMSNVPWPRRLFDFWQRRWLRTLPNYFLFLVISIVLVQLGLAPGLLNVNTLAYFVFLQNFIIPLDLFFWESWSLAVEEWFYLILPLLIIGMMMLWKGRVREASLAAIAVIIVVPTLLRFTAMDAVGDLFKLDLLVRKIVVLRLDTLGFGVLAAWVHHHFPAIWHQRRPEVFALGLIGLATATLLRSPDGLMYMGTWYYTLSGISLALMLPALSGWERTGPWGGPIIFLSRISYAFYLVYMPTRYLFEDLMVGRSTVAAFALYGAYWLLCLVLSTSVYRFWERPFMVLRKDLSRRILLVAEDGSERKH